ncbi:riboflavin biosynthesis protein RibF [Fibrobacterota bacterium]
MKIIRCNETIPQIEKSVLSVGNFDGVHNGHQFLIKKVCERAQSQNASSVIITFEPHTRAFLHPDQTPPRLTTFEEKAHILRNFTIDYLFCIPFNKQLADLSPEAFIKDILIHRFGAVEWIVGENHMFGKDRKGDNNFLHNVDVKNHFSVFTVKLHANEGMVASSTTIRALINESRIDEAVTVLGHAYPIIAERIRGMRKGFELGYPTLNFKSPSSEKVIPPPGVYAAEVEFRDSKLYGALYFGNCPTFENRDYHFEFHSLDTIEYDPGIHTEVVLWLHSFIRPDETFASEEQLVKQIQMDINSIKHFFKKE